MEKLKTLGAKIKGNWTVTELALTGTLLAVTVFVAYCGMTGRDIVIKARDVSKPVLDAVEQATE